MIEWLDEPEEHDFPAAFSYLSLILPPARAAVLVERLRKQSNVTFKAKDILRASRLEILGRDNVHVKHDLKKIKRGEALSPILLVRGSLGRDVPLTIADGYHRASAVYLADDGASIPCRIIDLDW